jgi:hypothetical protein
LIVNVGIDNKNSSRGHQNSKKSTKMAKPNTRPDGMAIGISGRPTPGNLFAMGWAKAHTKDSIQFFKPAKKKYIY